MSRSVSPLGLSWEQDGSVEGSVEGGTTEAHPGVSGQVAGGANVRGIALSAGMFQPASQAPCG